MSVKIRLKRTGRRHAISFRIVACDERSSRDGEVIERLGSYNPRAKLEGEQIQIKPERIEHWLMVGAQPTPTVVKLLKKKGLKVSEVRARAKTKGKTATT